jgi:hypothetical protein
MVTTKLRSLLEDQEVGISILLGKCIDLGVPEARAISWYVVTNDVVNALRNPIHDTLLGH